jgi:hypothetical protein
MTRSNRHRLAVLLAAACVVVALTAGVAIGAAGRGTDRATEVSSGLPAGAAWPHLWPPRVPWASADDVISVPGKKCPRSHPKKIGSSSSSSATQVDGGPVRRHSRTRAICAR